MKKVFQPEKSNVRNYSRYVKERYKPLRNMVYIFSAVIVSIFIGFILAVVFGIEKSYLEFKFPDYFYLTSLFILIGGISQLGVIQAFIREKRIAFAIFQTIAVLSSFLFLLSIVLNWNNFQIASPSDAYQYGISVYYMVTGMQFLYFLAVFVAMVFFAVQNIKLIGNAGTSVFFFSDLSKHFQLKLINTILWMMVGIWAMIYVFFNWIMY